MGADSRVAMPTGQAPNGNGTSTLASQVDAFAVYEEAVQTPAIECSNLASLYYGAQPIGSRRPEAKLLREDFSSTCAVATQWLRMANDHRSQAVDIDLDALKVAAKRLAQASDGHRFQVKLLQHGELNEEGDDSRWLETEAYDPRGVGSSSGNISTWATGATTDRFERKFQAKQAAKQKKKNKDCRRQGGGKADGVGRQSEADHDEQVAASPHLMLLHSSVLSLPVPAPPPGPSSSTRTSKPCAPDIVASLNYALSYFHKRKDMVAYLTSVRKSLRPETGVLVCDQFAGPMGEAALEGHGQGHRELTAQEEDKEQEDLWRRFSTAPGFLRRGERADRLPGKLDAATAGVQVWAPSRDGEEGHVQSHSQDGANAALWPRGRLSLVRTGEVVQPVKDESGKVVGERNVAFEYWREDTPVDMRTNRFRMSLSFRFVEDGSFIRDFFSYDFRFWTMAEVVEAMAEAGFAEITTEVLDRGAADAAGWDKEKEQDRVLKDGQIASDDDSSSSSSDHDSDDESHRGSADFDLLTRLEKEEAKKSSSESAGYRVVTDDDKVFARRSFATYVIARAPPQ